MIKQALQNLKISALNEMQQAAINAADKKDLILLSPTGSGKTLAFLLPLLKVLDANRPAVQAMVLAPSRELALQIEQVFRTMGTGLKVSCCYGGHPVKTEVNNLAQPPPVLIGTPGRIAHHLRRESFDATTVNTLVLDEFDKALEFGFQADMAFIIKHLTSVNRRILTSATPMETIPSFTGISRPVVLDYLGDPAAIPGLRQKALICEAARRLDTLFALICQIGDKATLIFCNHRDAVERISVLLEDRGLPHGVFHGGMEQEDRERALIKFRNGSHRVLITTDLASRGLDIPEIANIVHYQLPRTEEAFLHRNGRTARMHATGTSYLLLAPDERPAWLRDVPEIEALPENTDVPGLSPWATLYIAAGKKDKVNKVDIAGLLFKKGKLLKEDLGLIEVLDHSSYAAVARGKIARVAALVNHEKIKGRKVKIAIAR